MEPTIPASSQAKRTRNNVKQSKYGCLMCKKRRVKCDEYKPSCKRCSSYNLTCPGYPRGAPHGPWLKSSSSAVTPSRSILRHEPSQYRSIHTHLTCTVFAQGPRRSKSREEINFWSQTVPQLIDALPSVRAAASAFGSSYEVYVLNRYSHHTQFGAISKYCHALRLVQEDVIELPNGALPCMVACLLLAFTEVLQQRTYQAHLHVQGAAALIARRGGSECRILDDEGALALFEKLDLHSATYLQSRSTSVPNRHAASASPAPKSPDRALYRVLRDSYHFVSSVWKMKHAHPDNIPPELYIEQGRHVANLRRWLLSHPFDPSTPVTEPGAQQLVVLRAQCLAGLVRCSTILTPYERCYDDYGREFQEIIMSAELALDMSLKDAMSPASAVNLPSFTPEMGIIQPLFFTALKYRQPLWRRRALELLLKSGREGPWCGAIEGTGLKVIIEAEEGDALDSGTCGKGAAGNAADLSTTVLEEDRVHLCWVVGLLDEQYNQICRENDAQGSRPAFAQVQMSKCRDLDAFLAAQERGGELEETFWKDQLHWNTWITTVRLSDHLSLE